ncbi:hypothetical protein KGV55_02845 [Candidatus Gracilibacteria bacterium]|nr:hypothetical protein [Candidatus Gracilibacteria bacterium]
MYYIFLSIVFSLAALVGAFSFINFLQEIYLFDFYKILGFSVNEGYFMSILLCMFVYLLFSKTINEIFGKNVNLIALDMVNTFFQKTEKEKEYSQLAKKIYGQMQFVKLGFYALIVIFGGILYFIISFLVNFNISDGILTIGVFIFFGIFSLYIEGGKHNFFKRISKIPQNISLIKQNIFFFLLARMRKDISIEETGKILDFYLEYDNMVRYKSVQEHKKTMKNFLYLGFQYVSFGICLLICYLTFEKYTGEKDIFIFTIFSFIFIAPFIFFILYVFKIFFFSYGYLQDKNDLKLQKFIKEQEKKENIPKKQKSQSGIGNIFELIIEFVLYTGILYMVGRVSILLPKLAFGFYDFGDQAGIIVLGASMFLITMSFWNKTMKVFPNQDENISLRIIIVYFALITVIGYTHLLNF